MRARVRGILLGALAAIGVQFAARALLRPRLQHEPASPADLPTLMAALPANELRNEPPSSELSGVPRRPDLGSITQFVIVLVSVPTILFPVGMIVLWLQIEHTFTHDYAAAWYAATLPSKTSVLGFGAGAVIEAVRQEPFIFIVFAIFLGGVSLFARRIRREPDLQDLKQRDNKRVLKNLAQHPNPVHLGPMVYVGSKKGLIAFGLLLLWPLASWGVEIYEGQFRQALSFAAIVLGMTGALVIMASDYYLAVRGEKSRRFWFLPSFFVALFTVAVASIILATSQPPPLPAAELTSTSGESTTGTLLVHADSYWHIFNDTGTLMAIPDDEVATVRIVKN